MFWCSVSEKFCERLKIAYAERMLGGTSTAQRDFLETVSIDSASRRRPPDKSRLPPVANRFALGYTYQDVLDIDQEG